MGRGRLGSLLVEEEVVSRRMERTVYSLLGGVGVTTVEDGFEASSQCSSVLVCCCLTSRRDCSEDAEEEERRMRTDAKLPDSLQNRVLSDASNKIRCICWIHFYSDTEVGRSSVSQHKCLLKVEPPSALQDMSVTLLKMPEVTQWAN